MKNTTAVLAGNIACGLVPKFEVLDTGETWTPLVF